MKNAVFWGVAPCRSCVNRRFGVTYRLHLQGRKIRERGTSMSRWLQTQFTERTTYVSFSQIRWKLERFKQESVNLIQASIICVSSNFMEQGAPWEGNSPPLIPILSQTNLVHILPLCPFKLKVHFDRHIISSSTPMSPKCLFRGFPTRISDTVLVSQACYMLLTSHSLWFCHSDKLTFCEKYKLWSSLCKFLYPLILSVS
jgi:hypothetical protein